MTTKVVYFDLGNTLISSQGGSQAPFPDAVATVDELWRRGYMIGLLSDQPAGTTVADVRTRLDGLGFDADHFDVITLSSELDPPINKPDPRIFALAVAKAGHAAASTDLVFVTETLSHIEAARALGWRAIHKPFGEACTPASGECVADLADLLDLLPPLPVDLWLRDAPADPGADLYAGSGWWSSPDLWIRHAADGGAAHQDPEFGQDNWFYARVRNRGQAIVRSFAVSFSIRAFAGTQFVFPADYLPATAVASGGGLAPGDSVVVSARWPAADVPAPTTHACWLAAVFTDHDATPPGRHPWEHNNLAQKNLTIVDLVAGDAAEIAVQLGSRHHRQARRYKLEVHQRRGALAAGVSLLDGRTASLRRALAAADHAVPALRSAPGQPVTLGFAPGAAGFEVALRPREVVTARLRVAAPRDAPPGATFDVDLVQRDQDGHVVGGIAVQLRVVAG